MKSITSGASGLAPDAESRRELLLFLLRCFLRRQDAHLPSQYSGAFTRPSFSRMAQHIFNGLEGVGANFAKALITL
jgi:hypothetical protein